MGGPHALVESDCSTVETVIAVVLRNFIPLAIKNKCPMADAVAVASYNCAKVSFRVVEIAIKGVISQHDIGDFAVSIRNIQRNYAGAIGHDAGCQIAII